jgi:hypothetical protein
MRMCYDRCTKFHMSNSEVHYREFSHNRHVIIFRFTKILRKWKLTYFLKAYYRVSFQDPELTGAVWRAPQVHVSAMLALFFWGGD